MDQSTDRVVALLVALLVALPACKSGDRGQADRSQAAADAVSWEPGFYEVDINGDAVPDVMGLCADDTRSDAPLRICAVDGTSFALLWRSEPLVDVGPAYMPQLGAAGNKVVVVDALAILHVYDLRSGKELPMKHRFDQRAVRTCRPVEQPGKLWIETGDKAGWLFDPVTTKVSPLPEPRSCLLGRCGEHLETGRVRGCEVPLAVPEWLVTGSTEDRDDGLAELTSMTGGRGDVIAGFTPGAATPRWVHTVPPVELLRAQNNHVDEGRLRLAGGRVVAGYDDISGKSHLVAIDAKTGDQKWDVITTSNRSFVLTPTRIYERDPPRLNVRDAATGKLIGGVGASDYKSFLH